jgi:hypothetical protein
MDTWYSKDLGDERAAYEPTTKIQEAFLTLDQTGVSTHDITVFSRHDLEENVVTVYFTPSAQILAQAFEAIPCKKPTPEKGLALLVGDARNWETHFPGYRESLRKERF